MSRKLVIGWGLLLLLAGTAPFALRAWRKHQQRNITAVAQDYLNRGDLRGAYLTAQQARQLDPKNGKAIEILAKIAVRERSPAAILLYQELADLYPREPVFAFVCAKTALEFGETAAAQQALTRISEPERSTVEFHELAAGCALQEKSLAEAAEHFEQAISLSPPGLHLESLRLNMAAVRLAERNPATLEQARQQLAAAKNNPALRQSATRALFSDARAENNQEKAMALARELRAAPDATPEDLLLYLEVLQNEPGSAYEEELSRMQAKAESDPGLAYMLLTWLNAHGEAARSVRWLKAMPARLRTEQPMRLAAADAYCAVQDWEALRHDCAGTTGEKWGALEFLRQAYFARALAETGYHQDSQIVKSAWDAAVYSTAGNSNMLSMLARLAGSWGWRTQATQVWWLIARQPAAQRHALKELFKSASESKDAAQLYPVAQRIYALEPSNPAASNNVAMLGLLLGENLPEDHRLAGELYNKYPNSPEIASTCALSLFLQKRIDEAERIMARLPHDSLDDPSLSACYGIILAAEGKREEAEGYLKTARDHGDGLYLQELDLVHKARGEAVPATSHETP